MADNFPGTKVDAAELFPGQPVKVGKGGGGSKPDAPKTRGYGEELKRQSGLFARDVIGSVYGLGGIVSDPITEAWGAITGRKVPLASQSAEYISTDVLGLPQPETRGERFASGVNRALIPGAGFIKAGQAAAQSANPLVRAVGQGFAARPGSQVGAAIGGALASQQAQEVGAPGWLQFVSSLGGAAGGGAAVNLPQATANALRRFQVATPDQRAVEILLSESGPMGLEGQASRTQGVTRTLGEETQNEGIMALENAVRASNRAAFKPQDIRNNAARVEAMKRIAGTPEQLEAAELARDTATSTLRDQAFAEGRAVQSQAAQQAAQQRALRPEVPVQSSTGKAALRAKLEAESRAQGGRSAVQSSLNAVIKDLDSADDSVEGLYRVRKSINDLIEGKAGTDKSFAKAATAELLDARGLVDAEIATRAPSFAGYIEAYKQGSRPISRMQVGQELIESGSAGVRTAQGIPRLTPGTFAKANDLDRIAQQATGFRKAKASDILTADDIADIAAIQDDLQRLFAREQSAVAGSQTFERGTVGKRIARRGARLIPFKVADVLDFIDDRATDRVKERLAYLIANPNEARRIAKQLPSKDAAVLNRALLALSGRVAIQNEATEN